MNNFTYRSADEKQNIEAILKHRKRKFNMQQLISAIIFAVIIGSLVLYFAFHVYYTEYDGYVHVDANKVRTPFDIYLDSVYVHEGDIVAPGDTLYSYYIIEHLLEHTNPNSEPVILSRNRDIAIRHQAVASEIEVLRVRIQELKKQISVEDHNISYGLSSNSHKLDLQRELEVAQARLQALLRELALLSSMRAQTTPLFSGARTSDVGHLRAQQIYDDNKSNLLPSAISYHLASDSSIVTNLMAPDRMIFFKEEEIMTTQHLDLESNNLEIVAYIPVDKMHRITNRSKAKVVVNSDFSFTATVDVLGMRTDMIPENLRSYFSKKNTAIIAILKIDPGQTVPFWTMASGLPVSVRVRNTDTWGAEPTAENYLWYKTGEGIKIDLPPDWNYKHNLGRPDSMRQQEPADSLAPKNISEAEHNNRPISSVSKGEYYVIVHTLTNKDDFAQALDWIRKTYPEAGIIDISDRKSYVYSSRFATREEAQAELNRLRAEKLSSDAWIYRDQSQP